jgi:hypothetical protein
VIEPTVPLDEPQRLAALRRLDLLDSPPEARFDVVTEAAARAFDVPIALVTLVDDSRQWFKSRHGLDAAETPRAVSFCGHVIASGAPLVVEDARADERFHDNPLVRDGPRIRFYAGQPLCTLDGARVGTLCLIDREPRRLDAAGRETLRALAAAVEDELNAYRLTLGHHQLEEVIGRGGMGVVYKARDVGLGRPVALKVVHRAHAADDDFRLRFREEARGLAAVSHPNVMTVHEIGEEHGVIYMVSEFLPGGTLAGRLRRAGRLPPATACALAAQVARGLEAVHAEGLVHRDVKPANVLFDARGAPKLGDFGLVFRCRKTGPSRGRRELPPSGVVVSADEATTCEPLPALPPASPAEPQAATVAGVVLGTPAYMAPEQAAGRTLDARADLYSLGATLYALLTGEPPFSGDQASVLRALLVRRPPSPREAAPEVSRDLERLVLELLEKDPRARPRGAGAVAAALEELSRA